jgi:uncharacterized UPF0160 family protein
MFFRKHLIVTHNNQFHADDVCAVAVLHLVLKGKYKVIRSRDQKMFDEADYVVDVGGVHDASRQRFDHHQKEGAGVRPNGIPYATFGLVWKEYGAMLTGSDTTAQSIDDNIVAPCDASDNGFEICDARVKGIYPYTFSHSLSSLNPAWDESQDFDGRFAKAVLVAVAVIERAIERVVASEKGKVYVEEAYRAAEDKRIIVLNDRYPWQDVLMAYPEPLFTIRKREDDNLWGVRAVPLEETGFANRKDFPAEWAGLSHEELASVSGVSDATFCHRGRFLVVAKSKEGALALARKAIGL